MNDSKQLSRRIASGLSRIAVVLRSLAWKRATEDGITPTQAEILQQLAESPVPLRLGEVADALAISSPTASDAVTALVSKGFAIKASGKVSGKDRRTVAIKISAAGRELASQSADWSDLLARAVQTLSSDEQGTMLRALSKIIVQLQDEGAISAQRMCVTCQHFRPFAHVDEAKPHHCAFIDRAHGDHGLQLSCPDHVAADAARRSIQLHRFLTGQAT